MSRCFRFIIVSLTVVLCGSEIQGFSQQSPFPPPGNSQGNFYGGNLEPSSRAASIRVNDLRNPTSHPDPAGSDQNSRPIQDEPRSLQDQRPWDRLPVRPPEGTADLGGFQNAHQPAISPRQLTPANNTETRVFGQPENSSGWNNYTNERVVDPNLRLAGFGGNAESANMSFSESARADDLIKRFQLNRFPDPLPGVPLTIEAALSQTAPQNRAAMVQQYWATFGAWSRYIQARDEVASISRLARGAGVEGTLVQGALAIAENQAQVLEDELQNQQRRLQNFLPNPGATSLLALPADLPLVTVYDTHFETFASMNRLPFEHRSINLQLPKLLARIDGSAKACQLNQQAVQQLSGGNLTSALLAIQQSGIADRQFIAAVVNYNQMIGDYSLKVAPWETAPNRLASMLVLPTEGTTVVGVGGAPVRQAQLNSEPAPSRTGGLGFNQNFNQPVSAPQNGSPSPSLQPITPPPTTSSGVGSVLENPPQRSDGFSASGGLRDSNLRSANPNGAFQSNGHANPSNEPQANPQPSNFQFPTDQNPSGGLPSSRQATENQGTDATSGAFSG